MPRMRKKAKVTRCVHFISSQKGEMVRRDDLNSNLGGEDGALDSRPVSRAGGGEMSVF